MKKSSLIEEQNISYYNEIAGDYDRILNETDSNRIVRKIFSDKFLSLVQQGNVLDFGGGTGKDIEWLAANGFHIYFCEPSSGMREKAISYNKEVLGRADVVFLNDNQINYKYWSERPPFSVKVDAIISNFAVINCIEDISQLFKNLSIIMKQEGHLLALVLNSSFRMRLQSNRIAAFMSFFLRNPVTININFKNHHQIVTLHTINQIKKASRPFFHFKSHELVKGNDFYLIHLVRK